MKPILEDENQGEGDRAADRRYRDNVLEFVRDGRVEPAAQAARESIDADDDADDGPLPSFWTPRAQQAWDNVRAAMRRDWLQTKADLGLHGGADLSQTAKTTVQQAAGDYPGGEGPDWGLARHAIRLGYGAASSSDEATWSEVTEARLHAEWESMKLNIPWERTRPLVRTGWDQGVKDLAAASTTAREKVTRQGQARGGRRDDRGS